MRASRILNLLLVLQRQGRTSATELAALLEVSERTIRRDVEALGQAGVPVFAARGFGGGIELVHGFATQLTGLSEDEALTLLLVGQPAVAHRLGLGAPTRLAQEKLMTALGPDMATLAASLGTWFVHDPDPWGGNQIPHGELRRIADCIKRTRVVELSLGRRRPVPVRPLGLVLKAGSWHVVHLVEDRIDVLSIDDLRATRITRQPFEPPVGFDLATFWAGHLAAAAAA